MCSSGSDGTGSTNVLGDNSRVGHSHWRATTGRADACPAQAMTKRLTQTRAGEGMSGDEKSTDPGLSAAERRALRGREAKEAIADHEEAQRAFHGNRERLREERLAREAAAGPILYPAPELSDDTPIENVRFSTRIRNAVTAVGWKTVGEIREASGATPLGLQDLGPGSVTSLRETLGLPSCDGVRPLGKRPA